MTTPAEDAATLAQLRSELKNFQDITKYLVPRSGDVPRLRGIEMFGGCTALNGVALAKLGSPFSVKSQSSDIL